MNLLFIADIHIKLGQRGVPIEWAKNRFSMFVHQVDCMQQDSDIVVLGGDIFDRLPDNMEEIALYFDLVRIFKKPTYIYAGNHEALTKTTTFLSSLKTCTNLVNSNVYIIDDFTSILGGLVDIIPYNRLKDKYPDYLTGRIVCTHVRGEIPPHVKPEVNLDLFDRWEIVLAGDLHSYENSQRNILYPGSPFTTSFHRSLVKTGAILLDTDTLKHKWIEFELPQLLRLTVGVNDPKPAGDYHHIVYEIEGNLEELSKLEDNDLFNKKLIKKSQDSALILAPELSLIEELKEYLCYILMLPDDIIEGIIEEFNNNSDRLELL